ncbi:MAG: NADP-dependent isocitrate dehydrogenase, partial [Parasporobacterium sp.]|nr:NADP-dependent isocitrate dehydrogenase [Parasporobacterium sp.]
MTNTDPNTNLFIGTYKRIAFDMGCSEATIAKVMKTLQEHSFLSKLQNGVWLVDQDKFYGDEPESVEDVHVEGQLSFFGPEGSSANHLDHIESDQNQFSCLDGSVKNEDANKDTSETKKRGKNMINGEKIQMAVPLVEMDGDEMTRIIWKMVKDELLLPFIDLNTEYYDLGLEKRDETGDQITRDAANAIKKYGVGVKCATITPNKARVEEYGLKEMYKSPNGTIRAILDGTVFRAPIMVKGIDPYVKTWKKPITIARHAYGDLYSASELRVEQKGKAELVFTAEDGSEERKLIKEFSGPGIIQGQHNLDSSITSFARSCFNYALETGQSLWFSAKDMISKVYDHHFKDVFQEVYDNEYKERFEKEGIEYFYTLIDDAVARVIKSEGGFIWACKNYDGDVMSDMVATAFGALAMMTSVLVSPDGNYEFEAAHGTVQRHFYKYRNGERTSTNSVATIFAWTGALNKRGQLDGNKALCDFAEKLEKAVIKTIENGCMTKDLSLITTIQNPVVLNTEEFILEIRKTLEGLL